MAAQQPRFHVGLFASAVAGCRGTTLCRTVICYHKIYKVLYRKHLIGMAGCRRTCAFNTRMDL